MQSDTDWEDEATTDRDAHLNARVLVGDDDDCLRALLVRRLSDEGYEVFEAESGEEVLSFLDATSADAFPADGIDLLVIDHRMSGLSGLDVLHRLSALRARIPTILMTAFPDAETRADAARLGALVLAKPFALDRLTRTAVDALLARPTGEPEASSP